MNKPLTYEELTQQMEALKLENERLKEVLNREETQVSTNEEFLNQAINYTNRGILLLRADVINYSNKTAQDILACSKEALDGASFLNFVIEEQKGEFIRDMAQVINGEKETLSRLVTVKNANGKLVSLSIEALKTKHKEKPVSILISIARTSNIEDKPESEELNSREKLFRHFGSESIILLERSVESDNSLFSWHIKELNAGGISLLSNEYDFVKGKMLGNFLTADRLIELPQKLESDYYDEVELFINNKSKHFVFSVTYAGPQEVVCVINDTQEKSQLQDQLGQTLRRNELIAEVLSIFNVPDDYLSIFNKILTQVAFHFNTRRIIILNTTEDRKKEKLYTQWYQTVNDKVNTQFSIVYKHVPSWQKILQERKMILALESLNLPKDLADFFSANKITDAYVFPLISNSETVGSIIFEKSEPGDFDNTEINYLQMLGVLLSSLTTRKFNEEKLLAAKNKAEEADHLKSSFLANMSHDIRIPMTSIIGFSDLLADADLTLGEREEFVELISKSGQDLLTLVDNIVDIAKIETGQLRIIKDKSSLKQLLNEIYRLHAKNDKVGQYDDLELILDIPPQYEDFVLETDSFRLKQIWNNLIDNAIKFTDKGRVKFGISNVYDSTIEFYVQDSGIGIAEETQHIIFERFSKINRSYTKEYTGTGLGLAICKSLVEMLEGEIRVISYTNKGSTFYFTHPLPNKYPVEESPKKKNGIDIDFSWEDKTIVVVEDVKQNFKYLEYMLTPTKATIIWLKDGQAAVDYFKANRPANVVLMDIRLPVLDGLAATKIIKKTNKVPIIAQTAYTMGDEKELAEQAGCIDYISKPVGADVLFPILQKVFNL